ncbi:MAG TPA: hypothetical protein VJI96_04965 [Candidatus Andersenbacteria bacterium]|nr:hypothetical protein [Candidatus Andersenbacteria bacterium]
MSSSTSPVLEIDLDDFWNQFWSRQLLSCIETLANATETFRGKSTIKPPYRIPAADGRGDVFFDDVEMLSRFANFPTPTQANFLTSIRNALASNNCNEIVLMVPWFRDDERKLRIRYSGSLNFTLL